MIMLAQPVSALANPEPVPPSTPKTASEINVLSTKYVEGEILVKYKKTKINLDTSSGRTQVVSFASAQSLEKK